MVLGWVHKRGGEKAGQVTPHTTKFQSGPTQMHLLSLSLSPMPLRRDLIRVTVRVLQANAKNLPLMEVGLGYNRTSSFPQLETVVLYSCGPQFSIIQSPVPHIWPTAFIILNLFLLPPT